MDDAADLRSRSLICPFDAIVKVDSLYYLLCRICELQHNKNNKVACVAWEDQIGLGCCPV